jgi:hypothetical protein
MSERVIIPHTYLILDLITGQTVLIKRGIYYLDSDFSPIEDVKILFGVVEVNHNDLNTQFTILHLESPAPLPEFDVSVEWIRTRFCLFIYFDTVFMKMLLLIMLFQEHLYHL